VLKLAGLKPSAREILFDGADVPLGTMPDFQRSIPLSKALDPNTLLAYEMNGEPLPVNMGSPCASWLPDGPAIPGSSGSRRFAFSIRSTTVSG